MSNDADVDQIWIGFNDAERWEAFLEQHQRTLLYIGGKVVADSDRPLGFYFDPTTTIAAEVVAETFQISLDGLKRNPTAAAEAPHAWYIAGIVEEIR